MDGRLKPASKLETAELKDKAFKCGKCGSVISVRNVEFAEKIVCKICGEIMTEDI